MAMIIPTTNCIPDSRTLEELLKLYLEAAYASLPSSITTVVSDNLTVTTATTKVRFSATSVPIKYILVTGFTTNTAPVTIGGSTVVGLAGTGKEGVAVYPGQTLRFDVSDLNLLYADSEVNGEGVSYTYFS